MAAGVLPRFPEKNLKKYEIKMRKQKGKNRVINFENWYVTLWKLKTAVLTHLEVLYLGLL